MKPRQYTSRNIAEPHDNADNDVTDILMENVAYDMSPVDYGLMKLKALQHCLAGGKFVQSRTGNVPPDDVTPASIETVNETSKARTPQ